MKIKVISVTKLFGMFDHTLRLREYDHVTIMFGPNGIGKTVILNMVDGLFNNRYSIFRKVPFTKFDIEFDNGDRIWLTPQEIYRNLKKESYLRQEARRGQDIVCHYQKSGNTEVETCPLRELDNHERETGPSSRQLQVFLSHRLGEDVVYLGGGRWYLEKSRVALTYTQLLESYGHLIDNEVASRDLTRLSTEVPEWFLQLKSNVHTRLIQTQRLQSRSRSSEAQKYSPQTADSIDVPAVKAYSEELVSIISKKVAEYATLAQQLDSTFPARVISQTASPYPANTYGRLREELDSLSRKRLRLQQVGLLDKGEDLAIPSEIRDESSRKWFNGLLTVYVGDTAQKLGVFDDLADKIELLMKNINSHFSFKTLRVTKDRGFVFSTVREETLSPIDLSSGEQHELILNYEMLFRVEPNSLILIDEPELSLHIAWQQQFLADLLAITGICKFDVLVATHSPDIIHDRWDLTVDLGEAAE